MATTITATPSTGAYPVLPVVALSADVALAASDAAGNNWVLSDGEDYLVLYNSGGSSATVTITSTKDTLGRSGDITTYSVGAGLLSVFGPFKVPGWADGAAAGKVSFLCSATTLKCAVLRRVR